MEGETICDVCGSGIAYPVCFKLNPCSHKACVRCFHQIVPAGVFSRCPCSDCGEWITSSTLLESEGARCQTVPPKHPVKSTRCPRQESTNDDSTSPRTASDTSSKAETPLRRNTSLLREVQEVPHFQPDEQMDPFRHWAIKKPSLYTGFLYVAYRSSKDEATFYKSNFKAFDSSVFMDDDSTDEIVKIFARILHPLLFQRKDNYGVSDQNTTAPTPPRIEDPDRPVHPSHKSDPSQTNDCYRRQDRQHLAMRCLYALSSGRMLTRAEQEEKFGGTTKNLNQKTAPSRLATQHLARELLNTYQKTCEERKQEIQNVEPSLSSSTQPSSIPAPIVHDLRFYPDEDSEHERRKTPKSSKKPAEPQRSREEGVMNKNSGRKVRSWANELGLNGIDEIYGDDGEDAKASSPVVPAILWILSAAFILSK